MRITEITLRITQSDDTDNGRPETWDWPLIIDCDGESEKVELVRAVRITQQVNETSEIIERDQWKETEEETNGEG